MILPPCLNCGACCAHSLEFIPVTEADAKYIKRDLLTRSTPAGQWEGIERPPYVMKMIGKSNPFCIALHGRIGTRVNCEIYEHRPTVCRQLERGSVECIYLVGYHRLSRPW
jgi:Fe-S-cluster containining protein